MLILTTDPLLQRSASAVGGRSDLAHGLFAKRRQTSSAARKKISMFIVTNKVFFFFTLLGGDWPLVNGDSAQGF